MTEWEKAQAGYLYDANFDKDLAQARLRCADLCFEYNNCRPSETKRRDKLLRKILGKIKGRTAVTPPFHCDYGVNITVGENFYTNYNRLRPHKL